METTKLQAEVRADRGKGPARRLRASGKLPAVFYGPGMSPTPLTVDPDVLERHLRGVYGRNTLFELNYGDASELAMVCDLVVEPVSRRLLHVDFLRVSLDREVKAEVPLKTRGRAIGVVKGGLLNITRRSVPVLCKPNLIPAAIEVDVSGIDLHQTVTVGQLELPEGVKVTLPSELTLAIVLEDKRAARLAEEKAKAEAAGQPA